MRKVLCVGAGLLSSFCFWPHATGWLAYFIVVPFFVFSGIKEGRAGYLVRSYLYGFGYFLGSLYWIAMLQKDQITLPWLRIPAAAVLCLYLALFMLLTGYLARRLVLLRLPFEIALALAWGGVEYLRSLGPLGFPWASLGYSQTPYGPVVQQAAVVGTYGISAWLVLINGLIARVVTTRKVWVLLVAAAVFALPVLGGKAVLSRAGVSPDLPVALIQPNIAGVIKWDEAYLDSTMRALAEMTEETRGASMIVWPETAIPLYVKHSTSRMDEVRKLAEQADCYILTGFPDYERSPDGIRYYNSAMLISPAGEEVAEYRKIHLVPFGEMIPFEDKIPLLKNINFGEGDFSPGTTYEVFNLGPARFGVAICFESIYPGLVREFVRKGAGFIVNITNDEWFGDSPGPYQHAEMAVMRCVECRVGLARCANTGLSMLVDPYGRVTRRTGLFERTVLRGTVVSGAGGTPYVKSGYLIDLMWIILPVALAAASYLPRTRRKAASPVFDKGQPPVV